MGAILSEKGDPWSSENPPIISGHIHDEQKVGTNIWYPGSAMQHGYSSNTPCLYVLEYEDIFCESDDSSNESSNELSTEIDVPFKITRVVLDIKNKKII
jgi:hypothetical protein